MRNRDGSRLLHFQHSARAVVAHPGKDRTNGVAPGIAGTEQESTLNRMKSKVHVKSAETAAANEVLTPESLEDKFRALENTDRIEALLNEIKGRHAVN